MADDNLEIWRRVEKTDPQMTKQFSGKGGFAGTAISPMWLIRRATELWGPMGGKWGVRVLNQQIVDGIDGDRLHVVLAEVWFPLAENFGQVPCFGQTQLCGRRKDGKPYLDEEAPKKSLTDALTKGLSWLGFAADVHTGLYDDVKYVAQLQGEFDAQRKEQEDGAARRKEQELRDKHFPVLEKIAAQGREAFEAAWNMLSPEARQACKKDLATLKKIAPAKGGAA